MNTISERQNKTDMLNLLRARRVVLRGVKKAQGAYLLAVVAIPLLSVAVNTHWPDAKSIVALVAVATTLAEVLLLDRWRRKHLKMTAKLQEEFDCEVLQMKWNDFTAAARVPREVLHTYARKKISDESTLVDWYPTKAEALPMEVARLACQRANLWYDTQVRSAHIRWVSGLGLVFAFLLFGFGITFNYSLQDFILVLVIPLAPIFLWVVRECQRQSDACKNVERLLGEMDKSIGSLISKSDPDVAIMRSREIQDAIFAHRANAPLVSDLVYKLHRPRLEGEMGAGADGFIDELQRASGKTQA